MKLTPLVFATIVALHTNQVHAMGWVSGLFAVFGLRWNNATGTRATSQASTSLQKKPVFNRRQYFEKWQRANEIALFIETNILPNNNDKLQNFNDQQIREWLQKNQKIIWQRHLAEANDAIDYYSAIRASRKYGSSDLSIHYFEECKRNCERLANPLQPLDKTYKSTAADSIEDTWNRKIDWDIQRFRYMIGMEEAIGKDKPQDIGIYLHNVFATQKEILYRAVDSGVRIAISYKSFDQWCNIPSLKERLIKHYMKIREIMPEHEQRFAHFHHNLATMKTIKEMHKSAKEAKQNNAQSKGH